LEENGYPLYRRRNTGQSFTIPVPNADPGVTVTIDDRRVVPYNPFLCLQYKAHINVEICGSIRAVKYIHKYIYKGGDKATAIIEDQADEIKRYLHGRYIGPTEAVWRLFEFRMHEEFPAVTHLAIHLLGELAVYFSGDENLEALQDRIESARSTLIAFFDYNNEHSDGRQFLYQEFPQYYVYTSRDGWRRRQRGFAIGRMYSASPLMGERLNLKLLLTVVPGAKSYTDLRTVQNHLYPTFKGACIPLGLLEHDGEWISAFQEGALFSSGFALRQLFALALCHETVSNPMGLWEQFRDAFCDDLTQLLTSGRMPVPPGAEEGMENVQFDYGLFLLNKLLQEHGKSLVDFELPLPQLLWEHQNEQIPTIVQEELAYNRRDQQETFERLISQLSHEQQASFRTIMDAITLHDQDPHSPTSFFLHGAAGTGKTFLYNVLGSQYRAQGKIVICIASSGIATQLLPGGRTAHSRSKVPLTINHLAMSNISRNSALATLIQQTHLIIWDEVPMQHKYYFEAVSRTLNDICGVSPDAHFGSIPIILDGDFAQMLPIVRHGSRQATVQACLQSSPIWSHLRVLHLVQNMCIINTPANQQFFTFLQGLVHNPEMYGKLQIPAMIHTVSSVELLCHSVYPPEVLLNAVNNPDPFTGCAILAYRNDTVDDFNNRMISAMPGELHTFHAVNSVDLNEEALEAEPLAAEVLQSLALAGLPPSCLKSKVGAPLILLRNFNPTIGLCNGTCLRVVQIGRNCLELAILGGR